MYHYTIHVYWYGCFLSVVRPFKHINKATNVKSCDSCTHNNLISNATCDCTVVVNNILLFNYSSRKTYTTSFKYAKYYNTYRHGMYVHMYMHFSYVVPYALNVETLVTVDI